MMEAKLQLVDFGTQLWTRELAREVRGRIASLLDDLEEGDALIIDAKGVEVFDYSFANELFGKTILSLPNEYPGRFFLVENLTTYTHENLGKALESLSLMMIERKGKKMQLIGKVHPADLESFSAIIQSKGPVTATVLKDKLGIALTAMNERLSKLTNMGVVRRERGVSAAGREQYQYAVPF
jgi:hypothetical protein